MYAGRWFAIEDCLVLSKFLVLMLHKCLQNSALYWPMCSRQLDGDDGEARISVNRLEIQIPTCGRLTA